MYYGGCIAEDIANGPGIRVSLFVSGCTNKCKGCFNKELWNFKYGREFTFESEKKEEKPSIYYLLSLLKNPIINGLTLLGGDPLHDKNVPAVNRIIYESRKVMDKNQTIWIYTGYKYEKLIKPIRNRKNKQDLKSILENIDVLVDGPFEYDKKDITLKFKGSSNQRIIDMKKSLENNKIVLFKN